MSGTLKFDTDAPLSITNRNNTLFQFGSGGNNQNAGQLGASGLFILSNGMKGSFGFSLNDPQTVACNTINACDNDVTPPVFTYCPPNITVSTTQNNIPVTWTTPVASDNCSATSLTSNANSGQPFSIGTSNIVYTARDARSNSSTCGFSITVTRAVVQPICTQYNVVNTNNICGCTNSQYVPYGMFLESPTLCNLTYFKADTVLFTVNSDSTATLKGVFRTFEWKPVIVDIKLSKTNNRVPRLDFCQRDSALSIANDWRYFNNMSGTVKFDTAAPLSISSLNRLFQFGMGGNNQNPRELGASGGFTLSNGMKGNFGFSVSTPVQVACNLFNACLNDIEAPVFANCPQNISVLTAGNTAVVNWTPPTATDNCSQINLTFNRSSGQNFRLGNTKVLYTARDANNNNSECQFTITVTSTNTTPSCTQFNVDNTNNACGCADLQWHPYGFYLETANGCGLEYYKADSVGFQTYADSTASMKGTFRTLDWRPVVVDITFAKTNSRLPRLDLCTRDSSLAIANKWRYFGAMTGTLKIGGDAPLTITNVGKLFQMGVGANNQDGKFLGASGQFTLSNNVKGGFNFSLSEGTDIACPLPLECQRDIQAPVFNNCLINIVTATPNDSVSINWGIITARDNCSTPVVTSNFQSGHVFGIGSTTVIYTATDAAGNTATCRFDITIRKIIATQEVNDAVNGIVINQYAPNPATSVLTVNMTSKIVDDVPFVFVNTLGQVVGKQVKTLEYGDNNVVFDVSNLVKGVYILKPLINNGQTKARIKFVKI